MSYWKLQYWRIWAVFSTWDLVMKTGFTAKSETMSALLLQWPLVVPGTQKVCIVHQGITHTRNSVTYRDLTTRSIPKVVKVWSVVYIGTVLELFHNTVLDTLISLEIQVHSFLTIWFSLVRVYDKLFADFCTFRPAADIFDVRTWAGDFGFGCHVCGWSYLNYSCIFVL